MNLRRALIFGVAGCWLLACADGREPSRCFGTTSDGRLERGWKLARHGDNYRAYSAIAHAIGRTYVHSSVHEAIVGAYSNLARTAPGKKFVYGETGWRSGGEFKPHKTHRNGLSVDFMVPVVDANGQSVYLGTSPQNKWGYDLEFDSHGRLGELAIDVEAMAEHLYQLLVASESEGIGIWRVIFAPELQPLLHSTSRWPDIEGRIEFSKQRSWVRHDEHYHVDFAVPCAPAS